MTGFCARVVIIPFEGGPPSPLPRDTPSPGPCPPTVCKQGRLPLSAPETYRDLFITRPTAAPPEPSLWEFGRRTLQCTAPKFPEPGSRGVAPRVLYEFCTTLWGRTVALCRRVGPGLVPRAPKVTGAGYHIRLSPGSGNLGAVHCNVRHPNFQRLGRVAAEAAWPPRPYYPCTKPRHLLPRIG